MIRTVRGAGPGTKVSTIGTDLGEASVTDTITLKLLRLTCEKMGNDHRYGIEPNELGTRSIRSGGAMALFMLKKYSPERIMILGRWGSTAFLDYLRPQTLEWTDMMARDMARAPGMTDLDQSQRWDSTQDETPWDRDEIIPNFFRHNRR